MTHDVIMKKKYAQVTRLVPRITHPKFQTPTSKGNIGYRDGQKTDRQTNKQTNELLYIIDAQTILDRL